jgi:hypothetical protein
MIWKSEVGCRKELESKIREPKSTIKVGMQRYQRWEIRNR